MSVINILSPHVADMIAAGEVVERPASVIKELVENSFDAGAKNVTVEIRGGGSIYIRVTDDGCGMSPEDAGIAFMRHATSKLKDEKGLEAISTMGFRGEALAAISAVSHVELTSRRAEDRQGIRVELNAGEIEEMYPVGCPVGTTLIIRDIFFNTPARLKFLKSDRSEASACQLAALRCALARPDVSVRYIQNGENVLFSPGDGDINSCVYTLLGRTAASGMLSCASEHEGLKLTGYISAPETARGNRSQQYFFCNGRFIKSSLMQSALEQAYRNSLLTGRYPSCVLYVELNPGSVDVNVHPAKTEVKFSDEKKVFDLVYYAALSALGGSKKESESVSESVTASTGRKTDFFQSMPASSFRAEAGKREQGSKPSGRSISTSSPVRAAPVPQTPFFRTMPETYQTKLDLNAAETIPVSEKRSAAAVTPEKAPLNVEKPVQNVENPDPVNHKIVGEVMKTYIIVEQGENMILIDKHAAHERIIFDRLKASAGGVMSQTLLSPVTLHLSGEAAETLENNGELLGELGFEIEPFGDLDYIIRAVPSDMFEADAAAAVDEICEKLSSGGSVKPEDARDNILHTVACKAAIKAGWDTHESELKVLVDKVISGEVKYCPHGRPVSVTYSRKDLDKQFRRIV